MAETVTIALKKTVLWHDQQVREIVIKEPTGGMLMKHGNAVTWSQSSGGNMLSVEDPDIIRAYVEGCIAHEGGAHIVNLLGLEDAFAVRDAVVNFFTAARFAAWSRVSTSSSSN